MPSGPQLLVSQFRDYWCPNPKRLDIAPCRLPTHSPLILSTPGSKSTEPVWDLCPRPSATTWSPMSWHCPADPPVACGTQARCPAAKMWHFFSWSKVYGEVKGPVRSVLSFCTRHFYSAIKVSTLSLSPSSRSPNSLFPNSLSPTSRSSNSRPPNSPSLHSLRHAVTGLPATRLPLQFVGSYSTPHNAQVSIPWEAASLLHTLV